MGVQPEGDATIPEMSRRRLLSVGGVAAGALLLRKGAEPGARLKVKHVFSLVGEFSPDGAYVSSMVTGRDATAVDLAFSTSADMTGPTFVGAQTVDPVDGLVHHDLAGLLTPGSQYYARLAIGAKMFGRVLSFRTQGADADPMSLRVVLVSCQRQSVNADKLQPGWTAISGYAPDLLLHAGDFGYWDGYLTATDPYTTHVALYTSQLSKLHKMRDVLASVCSLIQVSDHEMGHDNGDTYNDPITETALEAYRRLMPYRTFDDPTLRSRFLTRKLGTNVLLISPDFRNLDRSPASWVDDASKTAYGEFQFALLVAELRRPEPLKILLSDPGCNPCDLPSAPTNFPTQDKWCNYQNAYQAMSDVVRNELTGDGNPINLEVWSGDRHYVSALAADNNTWGPFDVLTSSGIDMHSLPLLLGETFDQGFGYTPVGEANRGLHLHMEIDLTDDKLGTITRVARGIDDSTATEVVYSEKSWTYPVG